MLTNVPVSSKAPAPAAVLAGTGLVHGYFNYKVGTRSIKDIFSLWWQLIRWRPQVVVYMASFRGTGAVVRDSRFFSLCGSPKQIGVPLTESMQQNVWSEELQALEPEANRLARNLSELGDARLDDEESWDLRLTETEIAKAKSLLEPLSDRPIIAVSLGTKAPSNDWGRENWRGLLGELAVAFPDHALVLCGAAEEAEACDFAAEGWRQGGTGEATVLNLCGRLTPRESAAVFQAARAYIGHDSGPMHLAAAVQTPCVGIFSARNKPGMWFPYGRQHRVVYHRVNCWGCGLTTCIVEGKKCILSIMVTEVLAEVSAVLSRA